MFDKRYQWLTFVLLGTPALGAGDDEIPDPLGDVPPLATQTVALRLHGHHGAASAPVAVPVEAYEDVIAPEPAQATTSAAAGSLLDVRLLQQLRTNSCFKVDPKHQSPYPSVVSDPILSGAMLDAATHNSAGLYYFNQGYVDSAIQEFNQAIRVDHNFSPAYYNRAVAKLCSHRAPRWVLGDLYEAIRLEPHNPQFYLARGVAFQHDCKLEKAQEDYATSARLNAGLTPEVHGYAQEAYVCVSAITSGAAKNPCDPCSTDSSKTAKDPCDPCAPANDSKSTDTPGPGVAASKPATTTPCDTTAKSDTKTKSDPDPLAQTMKQTAILESIARGEEAKARAAAAQLKQEQALREAALLARQRTFIDEQTLNARTSVELEEQNANREEAQARAEQARREARKARELPNDYKEDSGDDDDEFSLDKLHDEEVKARIEEQRARASKAKCKAQNPGLEFQSKKSTASYPLKIMLESPVSQVAAPTSSTPAAATTAEAPAAAVTAAKTSKKPAAK